MLIGGLGDAQAIALIHPSFIRTWRAAPSWVPAAWTFPIVT
jgi:hypothetical protein